MQSANFLHRITTAVNSGHPGCTLLLHISSKTMRFSWKGGHI